MHLAGPEESCGSFGASNTPVKPGEIISALEHMVIFLLQHIVCKSPIHDVNVAGGQGDVPTNRFLRKHMPRKGCI
jgi:hypothetical protein